MSTSAPPRQRSRTTLAIRYIALLALALTTLAGVSIGYGAALLIVLAYIDIHAPLDTCIVIAFAATLTYITYSNRTPT